MRIMSTRYHHLISGEKSALSRPLISSLSSSNHHHHVFYHRHPPPPYHHHHRFYAITIII
jgi:hypothetical protein